jgi:urea transport system permease protein
MMLARLLKGDRGGQVLLGALLLLAILAPILNLGLPPEHPLHLSTYTLTLLGKYLSYALLAVAVDLVWGYLGILSLGHGAFFALGGYAMGMYLMRQIGDRGVYGNPNCPTSWSFSTGRSCPGTGGASTILASPC